MKKFFFLVVIMFLFISNAIADGFVTYTSYVSKCTLNNHNSVVIPVRVVSIDSGVLSSTISNYYLGDIDNINANIKIEEVNGNNILNVGLKDLVDGVSKIYFTLDKDVKLDNVDDILSFNLIYEFYDKVPSSINILGNNVIILDDKEICNSLNSFDIDNLNKQSIISEKKINNKYYLYNGIVIFIFIITLFGSILVLKKIKKI